MAKPLTVLFVVSRLGGGGAERTVVNIANHLDRHLFRPVLAVWESKNSYAAFLASEVQVYDLKVVRSHKAILPVARLIHSVKPDLIFSTFRYTNAVTVLSAALSGRNVPVVVRETNHQTAAGVSLRSWRERLVRWSYHQAARIVALSNGVRRDVIDRYGLPETQVTTIYNPVDLHEIVRLAECPVQVPALNGRNRDRVFRIIAVGRLARQKGFDLLIRAVATLAYIPYHLWILGEGPERRNLEELVRRLGVADRVSLRGFQENPYAWMARCDLFVLSSRWEGFGHVIAESMACGVPVLATRCRAGPDEIISHDVDGCLCEPESVSELTHNIDQLWRDSERRRRYAAMARESVRRFDVGVIVQHYQQLFFEVLSR